MHILALQMAMRIGLNYDRLPLHRTPGRSTSFCAGLVLLGFLRGFTGSTALLGLCASGPQTPLRFIRSEALSAFRGRLIFGVIAYLTTAIALNFHMTIIAINVSLVTTPLLCPYYRVPSDPDLQ